MKLEAKARIAASTEVDASVASVVAAIIKNLEANSETRSTVKKVVMGATTTLVYDWKSGPEEDLSGQELAKFFVGDLPVSKIEEVHKRSINTIHFICEGVVVFCSISAATVTVVTP